MELENLKRLIKDSPVSRHQIEVKLGLGQGNIGMWFKDYPSKKRTLPSLSALTKLADYFDVSIDYLVGREKPEMTPQIVPEMMERIWLIMTEQERMVIMNMLVGFIAASPTKEAIAFCEEEGIERAVPTVVKKRSSKSS